MTLAEAKSLLRNWFLALADAANGHPHRSLDLIVLGASAGGQQLSSPTEEAAIARIATLEAYADVARAYARLSPLHREVLWLLYGVNTTFRDARMRLGLKHNQLARVLDRALAAFITALGWPVTEEVGRGA
ncbi:MAG: hypothetical protein AB1609_21515 [Bacillota bacterium]